MNCPGWEPAKSPMGSWGQWDSVFSSRSGGHTHRLGDDLWSGGVITPANLLQALISLFSGALYKLTKVRSWVMGVSNPMARLFTVGGFNPMARSCSVGGFVSVARLH